MPPNYFSSKNLANYLAFFLPKVRPHGPLTALLKFSTLIKQPELGALRRACP